MYCVYRFEQTEDPKVLTEALWHHKIAHQVIFNEGRNELWLRDPRQLPALEQILALWKENPLELDYSQSNISTFTAPSSNLSLVAQFKQNPVTILLLLVTLLAAALTKLGANFDMVGQFTISGFDARDGKIYFYNLSEVMARKEYWRLFTPALLHFSVLHLVFNTLWVWDIGRKLERLLGSVVWAVGVFIVAVLSNILQYEISGYPLFGGLSGVVYGLIGFAWLLPILNARLPTIISKQLMIFFTVWLGIGYTPFPEMIGLGSIANTAHSIGLLSGLALCLVYWLATKHRYRENK
ncbi:protease [Marinomonas ushuaiensis DSM 15871]|uniref:Protease n=1 Tax=Marinomonas ushuaiensis DSM 15871 TaxID=1122207 RepID=X7E6J5_9GAMM|nr:rhomboid family intramembrane serine protease [Marinomonas ushuaiensis]ETX11694.1 protease [Marinomonas ushuaiensis DSM 15871]